jgi:hypothetical protein
MKANELMIDDWVMLNGSHYQIEEISRKGWVHLVCNGIRINMTTDYLLEVLQPIPLTPEILEKNGFKREEWIDNKGRFVSDDGRLILQNDENFINSFNTWYMHIDNEDFETIASCELSYVHQLQHALRLSGIDKVITI